ncbi:2-phospho-L-lactate transferase [Bradyrhizobium retamae]|uniref:2-phospho-L-lactate transferase n=1 Tax=Bradyrhizobium retamae TaxID=1300035 RepID=A0A0R3MM27_9BRAD|nr:2-phospho-L-lactate transferase [Bradyrhizobium retamae]KRR20977.1 2-phospho-L-lactate transferase [Bradyrhizobium retamae]
MKGPSHLSDEGRVVALCGGVGGAKLALGLQHLLGERLTVVVNVADDFEHLGLHISPDLDTVLYTLGGLSDQQRGWGRSDETWNFMGALKEIGGQTWFSLGDRDMAMHVERTRRRLSGETLTAISIDIARRFGVRSNVLPITNNKLSTIVVSTEGELEFQRYFVGRRCEPAVKQIRFSGTESARLTQEVLQALDADDLRLIILCPSNPYLSIDPMLAVPGMTEKLRAARVPVIAISPIIGGQAIKGPTRKIMDELGLEATNREIARHYAGLIDGLIIDTTDAEGAADLGIDVHLAPTLMTGLQSKIALAEHALMFGNSLRTKRKGQEKGPLSGGVS